MRRLAASAMLVMGAALLGSGSGSGGMGYAAPSKRTRHHGHAYRDAVPFHMIQQMMAANKDVMTRQVSRQLQRYRWKAMFKAGQRRGKRCPYERTPA